MWRYNVHVKNIVTYIMDITSSQNPPKKKYTCCNEVIFAVVCFTAFFGYFSLQAAMFSTGIRRFYAPNVPNVIEMAKDRYSCKNRTKTSQGVEDILCMKPPVFLKNYKNPCWYRETNGHQTLKCLPYFQIIGSAKCATSDLFARIAQHPQILGNYGYSGKETFYWSWRRYGKCELKACKNWTKPMPFINFAEKFPAKEIRKHVTLLENNTEYYKYITGHGDPMDIWGMYYWKLIPQNNPNDDEPVYTTPHLIKHVNPNIKLILLLRNPADRLFSHYLFRRLGKTPLEFYFDTVTALSKYKQCLNFHTARSCLFNSTLLEKLQMFPLHGSIYSVLLKEWFSVFPREQFLILRTEDYNNDISGTLKKVFNFLEVDPISPDLLRNISKQKHTLITKRLDTSRQMSRKTAILLDQFLSPYTDELAELLDDSKFLWKDTKTMSTPQPVVIYRNKIAN